MFFADRASSWIGLERDGAMVVRAGVADLCAWQAASLAQIAGKLLGFTFDRSSVHIGDSALTPMTGGRFATRQLYMSGNAVLNVARTLRGKLAPISAQLLDCEPRELQFAENRVAVREDSSHAITIAELSRTAQQRGVTPLHYGTFEAETGKFDPRSGRSRLVPDCTLGAHSAEIEINEESDEVGILEYIACHDVGPASDMERVEGRIQGAVAQGVGYALSEHVGTEEGAVTSTLFADYLIPTALDAPRHQGDRPGAASRKGFRSAPMDRRATERSAGRHGSAQFRMRPACACASSR